MKYVSYKSMKSRYTYNHLEKYGNAKVHERFCEVDHIFSSIVDCHRTHCNITRVLHQLLLSGKTLC